MTKRTVGFPNNVKHFSFSKFEFGLARVLCIICHQDVDLFKAIAGSEYASGQQAFACNDHVWNRPGWVINWAKFDIEQKKLRQNLSPSGGGS